MGPLSNAVAIGCLDALSWLLLGVAALIVALLVVSMTRADGPEPVPLLVAAACFAVGGLACRLGARALARAARR